MAAKKKATKTKQLCGHASNQTCSSCGVCAECNSKNETDVVRLRAQVGQVTTALGQAATREEQLKQYIASPHHRPEERTERDLAIARIVILRRRIEDALRNASRAVPEQHAIPDIPPKPFDLEGAVREALSMDDLTRNRSIEEVMMEAATLGKVPPKPKTSKVAP